jgi:threonine dehydratase
MFLRSRTFIAYNTCIGRIYTLTPPLSISPGGGGLLSGIATAMLNTGTQVFGSEPSFQGADDCRRGLAANSRLQSVSSLTIADGLRTPVGAIPWSVISDPAKVRGVFAVGEEDIKRAMRLVVERMKVLIEPSAAVPVAVVLFCKEFRELVQREVEARGGEDRQWNVGVVLSGGNTTLEAVGRLFAEG